MPPQWHQWLRRARPTAPTIQELVNDQLRQERIKILAQQADNKWALEKQRLQQAVDSQLQHELQKVREKTKADIEEAQRALSVGKAETENEGGNNEVESRKEESGESAKDSVAESSEFSTGESKYTHDPWKQADSQKSDMTSASITPRR